MKVTTVLKRTWEGTSQTLQSRKKQLDFAYDIFSHKHLGFIYVFAPFLLFFRGLASWIWRNLRSSMCHLPDHWSLCLGLSTSFWPDILYDPVTQVAIYAILRSRGLRVVLSASLFVAFLVATQLSVKIVESKPFNFRPNSCKACHDFWCRKAEAK